MKMAGERKYTITVLPGDGIGPEVCNEAVKILKEIAKIYEHNFIFQNGLCGGAAYTKYKNHLPEETLKLINESDAILFGSVGGPIDSQEDPKWKDAEKNCLLGLRKKLNLAINIRPAKVYLSLMDLSPLKDRIINKGVDIIVIRELISGIYFGEHKIKDDTAIDIMKYSKNEISLPLNFAFHTSMKRNKKLCVVDKANVLECSRLWRKIAKEISKNYPSVELTFMYIDNAVMQMIRCPTQFDVIVTSNMFGDILSDAASVLPGSLGLMPSASIGNGISLFEPIGGSAPDIAGKGIANPLAQILSASMLLRYSFNMEDEANCIEAAVEEALKNGFKTADLIVPSSKNKTEKPLKTNEMGDAILSIIQNSINKIKKK